MAAERIKAILLFRREAGDYHIVYAFGHGSKYIMIVPELELETFIAVTARNYTCEPTRSYQRHLFASLDREIAPDLEINFVTGQTVY